MLLVILLATSSLAAWAQDDAPAERRGLILHSEAAFDGLTLFAPLRSDAMRLVDMQGNVVHEWPEAGMGYGVLLEDGHLIGLGSSGKHPRFHGPGVSGGLIQEIDWDGALVWSHPIDDEDHQVHHDFDRLPNGNVLCIVREYVSREEAIARGRDPDKVDDEGIWPDALYELRPLRGEGEGVGGAEVVWEWHAWDHLVQDRDESKPDFGAIDEHPDRVDVNADHRYEELSAEELEELRELEEEMAELGYGGGDDTGEEEAEDEVPLGSAPDWLHTNAVTLHPELDLIVLSVPNLNELWILDHSTTTAEAASSAGGRRGKGGDILWRWGNPLAHGVGERSDQRLFFQHDPTWVEGEEPGELRLLVFNNGGDDPRRPFSSVDELVLPFDAETGFRQEPGGTYGPAEPAWTFRLPDDCTSSFISGVRRLPNGNVLICAGAPGRFLEVTRAGEVVWDYENPFGRDEASDDPDAPPGHAVYRATRIPRDHPGLAGRDQ